MKKYFFLSSAVFALLFFYSVPSLAQDQSLKNNFTITGKTAGMNGKYLYLSRRGAGNARILDSVLVKNNSFKFSGYLPGPVKAFLSSKASGRSIEDDDVTIPLYPEPGNMTIDLTQNQFAKAILKGSATNDAYLALERLKLPVYEKLKQIDKQYDSINKLSSNDDALKKIEISRLSARNAAARDSIVKELIVFNNAFVKEHPTSVITQNILAENPETYSLVSLETAYNSFSDDDKKGYAALRIKQETDRKHLGIKGAETPMFAGITLHGDTVTLENYQGKCVLLNFWKASCTDCWNFFPQLRMFNYKYREKELEIININMDAESASWANAIDIAQLSPLINISSKYNKTNIAEMYGVSSLPVSILIDQQSNIIERFGENGKLYESLPAEIEKLFAK